MRLSDRNSLIVIGLAAAMASAATVRALDNLGYLGLGGEVGGGATQSISVITKSAPENITGSLRETTDDVGPVALSSPTDRFDFVGRKDFLWQDGIDGWKDAALEGTSEDEGDDSQLESPDFWATNTKAAPPDSQPTERAQIARLAPKPAESLPWGGGAKPIVPKSNYTLDQRLSEITPAAKLRLGEKFKSNNIAWPPTDVALVAVKDEKTLELFTRAGSGDWAFVHRYKVLAASGASGPKLKRGDKQVPEGIYGISFLNPNSRYHVSMRVSYPNAFDKEMAAKDGRKDLGGDIMIHGKSVSIGCLAIGDEAAEELFVLASVVGLKKMKLIIAPTDLRDHEVAEHQSDAPAWLPKLYAEIKVAMAPFKAPPKGSGLLSFFGQ